MVEYHAGGLTFAVCDPMCCWLRLLDSAALSTTLIQPRTANLASTSHCSLDQQLNLHVYIPFGAQARVFCEEF